GTATVLFEMPGQQPQFGYDQELIDRVENGLWGIVTRMADGSMDHLNGDDFFELPRYWTDNVTDMKDVVQRYTNEGEIKSDDAARLMENHLTALEHFEKQENPEKMTKHLESFKTVLDHYSDQGVVTQSVYNRLNGDSDLLIERWSLK